MNAKTLAARVRDAHFFHMSRGYSDTGLTYQSCRFCGAGARDSEAVHDRACWFLTNGDGSKCRGLYRYAVRHYICHKCRADVLLDRPPGSSGRKAATSNPREVTR